MANYKPPCFTIITSCYNSTATLRRTYESLLRQKNTDFEWILIDDFSTDNGQTKNLIKELQREAPFNVKYKFLSKNYFSSRGTYEACLLAEGLYACILDHDDQLTEDVLNNIQRYINKYANNDRFAGVCGRCIDTKGNLIGPEFPFKEKFVNESYIRFDLKFKFELLQFTKVELLKKQFKLMKPGYTNGFAWALISKSFDYVFINDIVRVYDTQLESSYSNSSVSPIRYPAAKAEALLITLDCYDSYLFKNPLYSIRMTASMCRHIFNANEKLTRYAPNKPRSLIFFIVGIPLGFVKSIYSRRNFPNVLSRK